MKCMHVRIWSMAATLTMHIQETWPVLLHILPKEITSTSYAILNLLSNCVATQLRYLKEKEDHRQQITDSKFCNNQDMLWQLLNKPAQYFMHDKTA